MTAEILRFHPQMQYGSTWLNTLERAAPAASVKVTASTEYSGQSEWLVLWGPGAPNRWPAMRAHQQTGRHTACFDIGYWNRPRTVRVSIDAAHPSAWVMKKALPDSRWKRNPAPVRDVWRTKGPVIVAGIGRKARDQYGALAVSEWETSMIIAAQVAGRKVQYRRKQPDAPLPQGVDVIEAAAVPIDRALVNASLVITWHSNVAVDAIRNGIPVICRDGAAAAVYGCEWNDHLKPISTAVRDEFLANLAWYQWEAKDAPACWRFLMNQGWDS